VLDPASVDSLVPAVLLSATEGPPAILRFVGRLHPMLVHFPVALVTTALVAELLTRARRGTGPSTLALGCLTGAVLAAPFAAATGWILAWAEPRGPSVADTVTLHRWIGIGATVLIVIATWFGARQRRRPEGGPAVYLGSLVLAAGAVGTSGYLGAELVHGRNHLFGVFAAEPEPEPVAIADPGDGVIRFETHVRPIFEDRCFHCHSANRRRGELRLDDLTDVLAGHPSAEVLVPGDPRTSTLLTRLLLDPDDPHRMPADGEPLTEAQIDLVRAWIVGGAPFVDPPGTAAADG